MIVDEDSNATVDPPTISDNVIYAAITRIAQALSIVVDRSSVNLQDSGEPIGGASRLVTGTRQVGIYLKPMTLSTIAEIHDLVGEGYPVVLIKTNGTIDVFEQRVGRKIEVSSIGNAAPMDNSIHIETIGNRRLRSRISANHDGMIFVAKKELECDSFSSMNHHLGGRGHGGVGRGTIGHGHHGDHPTPLKRFGGMLRLDFRDILTIVLFAFVAGVLALATPLAVESMVNIVSWGTYVQPLLVVAMMLLACLGIAGFLRILQTVLVEIIQRRQLVRIVGDLAHRFPRANRHALESEYPRELANRVFDIMTIQKATAVLLLDGVSIVLTTVLGLLLLAFYHPFLLGFDIVLVISMISITWMLGRGGIRTAIDESIIKYRIASWLQDVIASPSAFKINGGEELAIERGNRLVAEYLEARQLQFRVVIRQVTFAIGLQVIASTTILSLGGWLVIQGQLTLGQLVASELVVTVVVGAFAKAGKSLEKFYDLMAGMDKVGHLLDIPVDPRTELGRIDGGPASLRWDNLVFEYATGETRIPATEISAGTRTAIVGDDVAGKSLLARSLAGLVDPHHGVVEVAGLDAGEAGCSGGGRLLAYAGRPEIFRGSVTENIGLGRRGIGQNRVREVIQSVGLWDDILRLPDGVQTQLQSGGYPLNDVQARKLMIARAICGSPRLLVIDGLLDDLDSVSAEQVWQTLSAMDRPWTLVVITADATLAGQCDDQIAIRG